MSQSLCILIRRPPYGQIHAAEALRHAGGALAEGIDTRILLIDDGVNVARAGQDGAGGAWTPLAPLLPKIVAKGVRVFAHAPSVQARGLLAGEGTVAGVELLDDAGAIRLLAESDKTMIY